MQPFIDLFVVLFFVGVLISPAVTPYLCVNPALLQDNTDNPSAGSGPISFGCQDVTIPCIGGGSSTFVMDAFTLTLFDSDWIVTNNSAAVPSKQKGQQKIPEYEITLQHIAGGGGARTPLGFSTFTAIDTAGRTLTWIVARIVAAGSNDGNATKLTIAARYMLN